MYSANRQAPLFEFATNRLALDPNNFQGSAYLTPGILLRASPDTSTRWAITPRPQRPDQLLRLLQRLRQRRLRSQRRELRGNRCGGHRRHAGVPGELPDSRARDPRCAEHRRVLGPEPVHQRDRPSRHTGVTILPQSPVVPDHLVGNRRAVWRGRAVHPRHHGGDPAAGYLSPRILTTRATRPSGVRERDNVTNFHNGKLE